MKRNKSNWIYYILMGVLLLSLSASAGAPAGALSQSGNAAEETTVLDPSSSDMNRNSNTGMGAIQAIEYGNCTHLYAVQPGDTLAEIASISATTVGFVTTQNGLDDNDDIYPGLVLCLETGDNGLIIPPTGRERSGVEVSNVSANRTVTVRGVNFPAGERMNVYIFQLGVGNPTVIQLDPFTIPSSGTFERSFRIPPALRSFRNLIVRFRNPDENVSASAAFINANVDRITPEECAAYYTVRSGDVLGLIAQDVGVSVERLMEINNLLNANIVFPGQMLCVEVK